MPKYLKYTLLALLWGGVAAYLLYAGGKVRRHRAEQPVTRIEVEVVDSTSQLRLVSEATVRGWLARSGIKPSARRSVPCGWMRWSGLSPAMDSSPTPGLRFPIRACCMSPSGNGRL